MSVNLYMDVHVPIAITKGLRRRAVDILTAQEDGTGRLPDSLLLDRATSLGRVLVSEDQDFLVEGARRQASGIRFGGIAYCNRDAMSIATWIADLELIAKLNEPGDCADSVIHLPL